ncbi:IS3 family transposase [Pedobacter sp. W3I1]|uniref:IS3 family transposase n=1 Tax=Pedobacter sp. W3I1 TaxID=3042291 RepID=UPI0027D7C1D1|nr:IS3 family transposase [Pedobacter sp. W3I1]
MSRQMFDEPFRKMALDLAMVRGSIKEVAKELGISPNLLSKWRERQGTAKQDLVNLTEDQKLINKLQKELKEAQLERDIFKKGGRHLFQGRREIFGFIKEHRQIFPVEKMCRTFAVSCSGFYYWLKHPLGKRSIDQAELLVQIKKIHKDSKYRYGAPRITSELKAQGILVSRPRVARLMRKANIKSITRNKYRVQTTDPDHLYLPAENILNRDFYAAEISQKWVSDLTYIRTGEGWLYLTTVMDLADRKIVGWALSETMDAGQTTIAAWKMAIRNRPITQELIFHSDRGLQYACNEFRKQLMKFSVNQSMSRKGNCWDNAVAESFFKTMKTEMVYHENFRTRSQARLAIFEYVEVWYNRKRRHSTLAYMTPKEFEEMLSNRKNVA